MSASQTGHDQGLARASTPKTPPIPVLGDSLSSDSPTSPSTDQGQQAPAVGAEQDLKGNKRKFWNLGRKKEEKSLTKDGVEKPPNMSFQSASSIPMGGQRASSPQLQQTFAPVSPGRNARSSSPQMLSPASSSIFERNVQEDVAVTATSPQIPSHITTENYIPPVLDASSKAITDTHLDPDSVEIVTHTAHQPAAVAVATVTTHSTQDAPLSPLSEDSAELHAPAPVKENEDAASTYGDLDTADVRRLSFISFADVVHAEHSATTDHNSVRDSMLLSGASSVISPLPAAQRSPSPVRSPISPPLSASLSSSPNLRGADASPGRAPKMVPGSPSVLGSKVTSPPAAVSGELAIETMTQALRKTGSGDLSGFRSPANAPSEDIKMEE